MARIDLPEDYAVWQLRKSVKESLMSHGEECVLMHTFHPVKDEGTQPRCHCFDDIYNQGSQYDCPDCFGTTFQGGIKSFARAWGLFGDAPAAEETGRRGVWHPRAPTLQTEHEPTLMEHDFVARVREWSVDNRPLVLDAVYVVNTVKVRSLRTGNRRGQIAQELVGQSTGLTELQSTHPIYKRVTVGEKFERLDGMAR